MKPTREQRANMTKEEFLSAICLLDDYIDSFGWHFISEDGYPMPNKHGYWCKRSNGEYGRLWCDYIGFYYYYGSLKVYVKPNTVIAWQALTEINLT